MTSKNLNIKTFVVDELENDAKCIVLINLHNEETIAVSLFGADELSRHGDLKIETIGYQHADDPIPDPSPSGIPEPSFYGRDPIWISAQVVDTLNRCLKTIRNNAYKLHSPRPQKMEFTQELIEALWYKDLFDKWGEKL